MRTESVGSKLLSEIERISARRERWRGYLNDSTLPLGNLAPAILLMTAAIDEAKAAIAGNDAVRCIAALQALEGYRDDD